MITVNGNHLRNMPEQISKNTEDILDLQDATNALDGRVTDLENSVISDITLNDLHTTGDTHLGDDAGDQLVVAGGASFGGGLTIMGNETLSGTLNAGAAALTGALTAATISASGNASVGGNLEVAGTIKSLNNIIDSSDRRRFQEWDGAISQNDVSGLYCKASLSGTHIMFVLAGRADNGSVINASEIAYWILPQWIIDKIVPVFGGNWVERKSVQFMGDDWTTQNITIALGIDAVNKKIYFNAVSSLTLTADRGIRVQFDLLIDNQ